MNADLDELAAQLTELRTRVEASEGVLQIHALKSHYANLVDRRFAKGKVVDQATLARIAGEIADLFIPDGVWDGGPGLGVAKGRAAIVDRLERPTLTFSRHLFTNPVIDVQGDRGVGYLGPSVPVSTPGRRIVLDVWLGERPLRPGRRRVAARVDDPDDVLHGTRVGRVGSDLLLMAGSCTV